MLDAEMLELAKSICAELLSARERGSVPMAIVVDQATSERLETARLGFPGSSGQPELFNLPLKVESGAEGWAVRVR